MPTRCLLPTSLCLSIVAALLAVPAAQGATSCFNESCSMSCSPDLPVEISTLIPASEFPPEGDTPIAFVDPNDGRGRRLIATQEGVILVWDGATQTILPEFFLDLRGPVLAGGERGLLAMVVEPDYAQTGSSVCLLHPRRRRYRDRALPAFDRQSRHR